MGRGQKIGFRHTAETKARISATMKPRGRPNGFNQKRDCTICGHTFSVTNIARHSRACSARAQHPSLAGRELAEIKMMRTALRQYGLTIDEYFAMLKKQSGGCAICGVPESGAGRRLSVDHCHETGTVRGLLCSTCNFIIGSAKDDADLMRRAADYMERTDARDYERDGCDSATPRRSVAKSLGLISLGSV